MVYLDAKTDTYLEEVSSCNIFVRKGKTIKTPPLSGTILPGRSVAHRPTDGLHCANCTVLSTTELWIWSSLHWASGQVSAWHRLQCAHN